MISTAKSKDSKIIGCINKDNKQVEYIYLGKCDYKKQKSFDSLCEQYNITFKNRSSEKQAEREFNKIMCDQNSIKYEDPFDVELYVDLEQPQRILYLGPTGSGKSYLIGKYIEKYKKHFKNNKIYLFSDKPEDPALDKKEYKVIRIALNDQLYNDPIQADELANSLVIFDDIDSISDKNIRKAVYSLKDQILKRGRSLKIYELVTVHNTEYGETRTDLANSTGVYFFPKMGAPKTVKYVLENYFGLDSKAIKKIMSLPSRWVYVNKLAPNYVLYELGCYVI